MLDNKYVKFIQLTKVDEEQRLVGGIVTAEIEDKEGEICDYASSKPFYEAWSGEAKKATEAVGVGTSVGNLRLMHTLETVGVGKDITFDDGKKSILMEFKVVDDKAWKGVKEGMYTGFSQGGKYEKRWVKNNKTYYTANPSEVSLVDNPCLGVAHFEYVKADGTKEMRKFKDRSTDMKPKPAAEPELAATVSPEDLPNIVSKAVAEGLAPYADLLKNFKKQESDKQLPDKAKKIIAVVSVEGDKELRAWIGKNVKPIAETFLVAKGVDITLNKGLYTVGRLAQLLEDMAYIQMSTSSERYWEQDGSTVPDELMAVLEATAAAFVNMASEEAGEVVSTAREAEKEDGGLFYMSQKQADLTKAVKSIADHVTKLKKAGEEYTKTCVECLDGIEKAAGCFPMGEPAPIDVQANATPNTVKTETPTVTKNEGVTVEQVQDIVTKSIEGAIGTLVKALSGEEDKPAESTEGIGDRSNVEKTKETPVLKTVPITKKEDNGAAPTATTETYDVSKAMAGDVQERLKMMRGVKPAEMPTTVEFALQNR